MSARRLHAESFRAKVELPSPNAIGTEGNTAFQAEVEVSNQGMNCLCLIAYSTSDLFERSHIEFLL